MKISNNGIELIKHFESCRLKAYKCPAGVWTIGYGHTRDVKQGDVITPEQAERFLLEDVQPCEDAINKHLNGVVQHQFDALVSFAFNVGVPKFLQSALLRVVRNNPADVVINALFLKRNKAYVNGVLTPLPGLTRRRKAESHLYFNNELKFQFL